MGVFISDMARNTLIRWTTRAVDGGYGIGAYMSPFTSPMLANGYKRSAEDTSDSIRASGGEFWFDPMTYALNTPRAGGDFRHYDTWNLWPGQRGDLNTPQALRPILIAYTKFKMSCPARGSHHHFSSRILTPLEVNVRWNSVRKLSLPHPRRGSQLRATRNFGALAQNSTHT